VVYKASDTYPLVSDPYQKDGRWYIEKECPMCLHITTHQANAIRGPYSCLRCERIMSEANFDAMIVSSLLRLGILNKDGSLTDGVNLPEEPPF
jgi:phage FluMu protein Com